MKIKPKYQEHVPNASKRHKQVGEILRSEPPFKWYASFQEYPLKRIDDTYPNGRLKLDWYIPALRLAIEVHGEQHYQPVNWGKEHPDKVSQNFILRNKLDQEKASFLEEHDIALIEIHYTEEINLGMLKRRALEALTQ